MKAAVLRPAAANGAIHFEDRPDPSPGPGEVVIRIRAASLNYRDLLVARNLYGSVAETLVPLSDGAGEVIGLGAGVVGLEPGNRVAANFYPDWTAGPITEAARRRSFGASIDGMAAEAVCVPAVSVVPIPPHLSFAEAACLPCAGVTAWNALRHCANVSAGDVVVLLGTGGVSMMALPLAKAMGARVIQTSGDKAKQARLGPLGADHVVDYKATPDWDREVLALTEGGGADAVLEVGGSATLPRSFRAVRFGGTVATIGFVGGSGPVDPRPVISKAIRFLGLTVGSAAMFGELCRAMALHELRPVIDRAFAFDALADAYAHLASGRHFGKIVVSI